MATPLAIDLIRTDGGTQMRAELNQDVVKEYRELWLSGFEFPAIDVYHDGTDYWPSDGFHRLFSAIDAKLDTIQANVRRGTQRMAVLEACKANKDHGLRRSNADKRKAVDTMLGDEEWATWSDNKIAEHIGVHQTTVSARRKELMESISSPAAKAASQPRVGRDGKKRKPPQKLESGGGAVSRAFENLGKSNGKSNPDKPTKPSKGREVSPAKMVDGLMTTHVSPLVRGIDSVAEVNGGKGDCHRAASQCIDDLIEAMKRMREGQR